MGAFASQVQSVASLFDFFNGVPTKLFEKAQGAENVSDITNLIGELADQLTQATPKIE